MQVTVSQCGECGQVYFTAPFVPTWAFMDNIERTPTGVTECSCYRDAHISTLGTIELEVTECK